MRQRNAFVVGGSDGLGRDVVRRFASSGWNVAFTYFRGRARADKLLKEINVAGGKSAHAYSLNLGNQAEVAQVFRDYARDFGSMDSLIFSAALSIFKPLHEFRPQQVSRILDVNVRGFHQCVVCALEAMRKGGSIIALSSLGSGHVFAGYGAMGMAKAAIESLVRYFAFELAKDRIRVNTVSAGPVDTPNLRKLPNFESRSVILSKLTPLGRMANTSDLVEVVRFLCSSEAGWITGQTVVADGGLSLRIGET